MKQLTLLIGLLFFVGSVWAQGVNTDPFEPTDRDKLFNEIEEVLTQFKREDCEETLKRFKRAIKERRVTEQHYEGFLKLTNQMVGLKMKRYNYIRPLLETIVSFAEDDGLTQKYFDRWIDISLKVLEGKEIRDNYLFENYLKWSLGFWIDNNLYKVSRGSHTWKADSRNFVIKFEEGELGIQYKNTTLYCFNKGDSLTIEEASGVYYPLRKEAVWKGERGVVYWRQEGAEDARCEIQNYDILAKQTSYKVDSSTLIYLSVFKEPMVGIFEDRISRRSEVYTYKDEATGKKMEGIRQPTSLSYPRFYSTSKRVAIEDIGEGVDYRGGFKLEGNYVRGYGDKNDRSVIEITNSAGDLVVRAFAETFDIAKGQKVESFSAEVSIYFKTENGIDSIYHPNILMRYDIKKKYLSLERGRDKTSKVPFSNSLQDGEMRTNSIRWQIDSDEMELGDNKENMEVTSDEYFDDDVMHKYQLIGTINPIIKFGLISDALGASLEQRANGECPDDEMANWDMELSLQVDDSRRLPPEFLLGMLDKRMEKLHIMDCKTIQKAKSNPKFKVIRNYDDWNQFEKGYPSIFSQGMIDAYYYWDFINDVRSPSHNRDNGSTLIQEMIADGFITYDPEEDLIVLRKKLFHYKESARKSDFNVHNYDQIKIKSVPSKAKQRSSNATFNLKDQSMETKGVIAFTLSDSQRVYVSPLEQTVEMLANKDMLFNGVMEAGLLKFTGQNFRFYYESYEVAMDSIDFIDFYVYEREKYPSGAYAGFNSNERAITDEGQPSTKTVLINNQLRNTKGVLSIDAPSNKSGKQESPPEMPSVFIRDTAYVYFERESRLNEVYGEQVYPKEDFYYQVYPDFEIHTLKDYDSDNLRFRGCLTPADIFPKIYEPLKIMYLDLSLGFESETPGEEGYPIYLKEDPGKGKGRFKGAFGISNQGFLANGTLDYLGATISSEYIELLPERFVADSVKDFALEEEVINGVEFPKVDGQSVFIDWAPYSDSMYIESDMEEGVPFQFFESGEYVLDGSLNLTPNGLLGRGIFEWDEATLKSNPGGDFKFGRNSVTSPSTAVSIKQQGEVAFAFDNNNVEAVVDFDKRIGDFIAREKDLSTDLPYNSYKTSLDRFHWDMDKRNIHIDATEGKAGFFLATEESQDSLYFMGESADYDLNTGLLQVDGVDYIRVADAFIYPINQHIEIEGHAHMRTLDSSRIVADTFNQNHQILDATINIISKREYTADGFLEFDVDNFKDQKIKFDNIRVKQNEAQFITFGSGVLEEQDSFYLDRRTRFKGDVEMSAESKNLTFRGFAKLTSSVIPKPQWFGIDARIDKKNVAIDYELPTNPEGEALYVGLYLGMDSLYLYPSILAPKRTPKDRGIFEARGLIKFHQFKQMYMFGDSVKVMDPDTLGNLMTVSEKNAKVEAVGSFNLDGGFKKPELPPISIQSYGDFSFFLNKESEFRFDMASLMDFYLPDQLANLIIEDLQSNEETIEEILYTSVTNRSFKARLKEFIPENEAFDKVWKKVANDNRLVLPKELTHTLFFSKMIMKWSPKTQSFVANGRLQLASLMGTHIGQVLKGAVEVQMDPSREDVLNIYFVSPNGEWYYFQYSKGILTTASSKPEYNNAVAGLKRKFAKVKINGNTYSVEAGNSGLYSQFRLRANSAF